MPDPGEVEPVPADTLPQGFPEPDDKPDDIGLVLFLSRALVGDVRMETVGGTATPTPIEPLPGRA
jgi:hypothetical protein